MKTSLHILSFVTFVLTAILMCLVGYWIFYPYNIITIEDPNNVKVDKQIYKPGDRLTYTFDYCKDRQIVGTVYRALVDGIRINRTEMTNDLTPGCRTLIRNDLVIPTYVGTDTYHIEATIEYKVNPIRTIKKYRRSEDFKIIK